MNVFPKLKLRYFRQLHHFAQLKKHQWLKEKDLVKIQEKKLRSLIKHAYQKVPYYHDLFDSIGIKPQNIRSVRDLRKIPILTKENLRKKYPDEIITKGVDTAKCQTISTTGSTGTPIKVAISSREYDYIISMTLFVYFGCGVKSKDKLVTIRHKGYQIPNNILFKKTGIFNWKNILIFNPVDSILDVLKKCNPDIIHTYPSILLLLSKEVEEQNISGINPRLILADGETLSDNSMNRISKIFSSDIYRMYGAEEFGRFSFECKEHSGYHIISDAIIIEIVKEDRNVSEGGEGEIIATNLFNYTMPLIRYKLGDIGTFTSEKCACGRGFPLIKSIEGRTDDFLILPSGRKISPRMINVIEDIPGVSRYQTIQESKNRIVVNLIKGDGFNQTTKSEIKKHIKKGCLSEDVEIEVNLVMEIPPERTGKLRAVVSNVKE